LLAWRTFESPLRSHFTEQEKQMSFGPISQNASIARRQLAPLLGHALHRQNSGSKDKAQRQDTCPHRNLEAACTLLLDNFLACSFPQKMQHHFPCLLNSAPAVLDHALPSMLPSMVPPPSSLLVPSQVYGAVPFSQIPGPYVAPRTEPAMLDHSSQKEFNQELCILLIMMNVSWWSAEHPYVKAHMPDCKELGGHILDLEADRVTGEMREKVEGSYATGQCDGWKNVAKRSLIGMLINVEYKINLVVGNIFKVDGAFVDWIDHALDVIKWTITCPTKLLSRLTILALILPVITRWTSHYLSVMRLMAMQTALETLVAAQKDKLLLCAGSKPEAVKSAELVIQLIGSSLMWNVLKQVKKHIKLLAIAANITQSNAARLDTVLVSLFVLWHFYRNPGLNQEICHKAVIGLYQHMWNTESKPDDEFIDALQSYFLWRHEFVDSRMCLDAHAERARNKKQSINIFALWGNYLPARESSEIPAYSTDNLGPPPQGFHGFIKFVLAILSIVPNSAVIERLFSQFGIIHTKLRNCLHFKNESILLPRSAQFTETGDKIPAFPNDSRREFYRLLHKAQNENLEDAKMEALDEFNALEDACRLSSHHRMEQALLLENLFKFPAAGEPLPQSLSRVSDFWSSGEAGLDAEIAFHEEYMREMSNNDNDG
ncbi:hypothetical protein CYLTODRAFT_415744, partial [Cylindrobasidium torrendii FP15055 ss-10]